MVAKHILTVLAGVFMLAALSRLAREGFKLTPGSRTWLVVAVIFGMVSSWLWMNGAAGA